MKNINYNGNTWKHIIIPVTEKENGIDVMKRTKERIVATENGESVVIERDQGVTRAYVGGREVGSPRNAEVIFDNIKQRTSGDPPVERPEITPTRAQKVYDQVKERHDRSIR